MSNNSIGGPAKSRPSTAPTRKGPSRMSTVRKPPAYVDTRVFDRDLEGVKELRSTLSAKLEELEELVKDITKRGGLQLSTEYPAVDFIKKRFVEFIRFSDTHEAPVQKCLAINKMKEVAAKIWRNPPTDDLKGIAVEFFELSANAGDSYSQIFMGDVLVGNKDFNKARKYYALAAEQGDAKAQNKLGICYYNGDGVASNKETAVDWYRKSSNQGHVYAKFNLARMYERGEGLDQDLNEAVRLYVESASCGDRSVDALCSMSKSAVTGEKVLEIMSGFVAARNITMVDTIERMLKKELNKDVLGILENEYEKEALCPDFKRTLKTSLRNVYRCNIDRARSPEEKNRWEEKFANVADKLTLEQLSQKYFKTKKYEKAYNYCLRALLKRSADLNSYTTELLPKVKGIKGSQENLELYLKLKQQEKKEVEEKITHGKNNGNFKDYPGMYVRTDLCPQDETGRLYPTSPEVKHMTEVQKRIVKQIDKAEKALEKLKPSTEEVRRREETSRYEDRLPLMSTRLTSIGDTIDAPPLSGFLNLPAINRNGTKSEPDAAEPQNPSFCTLSSLPGIGKPNTKI
ncbi:hypothetical protein DID78_05390 [Candidatus Marinamargulisbacteria bacterium SCGC AG-343-D04]|nr:hypothetical protein DID78_05390 [Candidatus Marinamargulisbacteria bacterium SCGC AG-343-D04]